MNIFVPNLNSSILKSLLLYNFNFLFYLHYCIISLNNFFTLGKPSPAFNNLNSRSTSSSRFGSDFSSHIQEKTVSSFNNLYGSSSATNTTKRFPIGTFDSNNMFNSSGDAVTNFSNGSSIYNDANSGNLGTRETGIIEKLLVSMLRLFFLLF